MYNGLLKIMWSMKSSAAYQVRYSRYVAIARKKNTVLFTFKQP